MACRTWTVAEPKLTVDDVMALVSEYGQCRWSEGSSGATFLDRMGERRSREEAADLYQQIRNAIGDLLAHGVPGTFNDQPEEPRNG